MFESSKTNEFGEKVVSTDGWLEAWRIASTGTLSLKHNLGLKAKAIISIAQMGKVPHFMADQDQVNAIKDALEAKAKPIGSIGLVAEAELESMPPVTESLDQSQVSAGVVGVAANLAS